MPEAVEEAEMEMEHLFPFGGDAPNAAEAADVPLPPVAEVSPTEVGSIAASLGAAQPPAVPSDSELSSSRLSRRGRSESTNGLAAQMKDMQHSILGTLKVSLSEVASVQKAKQ